MNIKNSICKGLFLAACAATAFSGQLSAEEAVLGSDVKVEKASYRMGVYVGPPYYYSYRPYYYNYYYPYSNSYYYYPYRYYSHHYYH